MINHAINSLDTSSPMQAKSRVANRAAPRVTDHPFGRPSTNRLGDIETARSIDDVIFRFIQDQPSQLYRGGA